MRSGQDVNLKSIGDSVAGPAMAITRCLIGRLHLELDHCCETKQQMFREADSTLVARNFSVFHLCSFGFKG
jgi:hypothetical protein